MLASVCRDGEFECYDYRCIRLERRCDGYSDCSEGEDELECPETNSTQTETHTYSTTEYVTESPDYLGTTTDYCK